MRIIKLYGTWSEMGEQYGLALKSDLNKIYDTMYGTYFDLHPELRAPWTDFALMLLDSYPAYLKRFFEGLTRSSGLDKAKLALVNAVEYLHGLGECSFLAARGEKTENGLILGRNYDYTKFYRRLAGQVIITVFHPSSGTQAFAIIGYAGEIWAVNGLNESGLFMELNNATPSGGTELLTDGEFATTQLFQMMLECESVTDAVRFLKSRRCCCAYIIGLTDGKELAGCEWDKTGLKLVPQNNDTLCFTNTYQNPEWSFPVPEDNAAWHSHTRRNNLTSFVEGRTRITSNDIKHVMSLPIDEGGAYFTDKTVYQIVYEPGSGALWTRAIDGGDWEKFDFEELFK